MSPMVAKCDLCERIVTTNVAKDPIYIVRNKLTVRVEVVKREGSDAIVCPRCVILAVYNGEIHGSAKEDAVA